LEILLDGLRVSKVAVRDTALLGHAAPSAIGASDGAV